MYKEYIICIVVILLVILLEVITQNLTQDSLRDIIDNLYNLRDILKEEMLDESDDKINESNNKIYDIIYTWDEKYEVLSFYIEHNELEKVKTELVELNANTEIEKFGEAIGNVDRTVYLLEHIKQKMSLQVKNIF